MKRIFSRSLKTTLFGLGSIVLAILPIFVPAATPVCLKLSAVLGGLGLVAAQDNQLPPAAPRSRLNSWLVLPLVVLVGLASVAKASAFMSQWQPKSYRVFIGTGNPNEDAYATNGGVGSVFYDVTDEVSPVVWIKTGTNGYFKPVVASAVYAANAGQANYAGNAYVADAATTAVFADSAQTSRGLFWPPTGMAMEFNFGADFNDRPNWSSQQGIGARAFYTDSRTNLITVKPSAVAAFLALVPNSLQTNSVVIGQAPP